MAGKKTGKRLLTWVLVLVMALSLLPVNALAARNSTVELHPSVGSTVTGVKVKVGDKISGYKVSSISGYDITVDLGKYNVNNNTFRLPYAKDIWNGVDNNKVDYISWAGTGSNRRSEGASALLANGKNTAYYYFKGTPVLLTFTLNYDANDGTGAPASQTYKATSEYEKSHTFTISPQAPTRDGYTFLGWNTNRSATTANYQPNGSIVVTGTTTLYAVWEENTPPKPDKPTAPDEDDLSGLIGDITVKCTNDKATHTPKSKGYALISGSYTTSEVEGDAESGYTYTVTINAQEYVKKFDADTSAVHTPKEDTATVTLEYKNNAWYVKNGTPIVFNVVCDTAPDDPKLGVNFEFKKNIVDVICETTDTHNNSYRLMNGYYTVSDKTQLTKDKWQCKITIDLAKYFELYNSQNPGHTRDMQHEYATSIMTIYPTWHANTEKWSSAESLIDAAEIYVKCDAVTPPEAPTADELEKLEMAVLVKYDVDDVQQHTEAYGLLGEYNEDYIVGEPKKVGNDWLCEISYDPDLYVAEFNTAFPNLKHVRNDEKIVPVTLIWADGSWQLKTQGSVHVTEEYTVTFNAYGGFPTPDEQHVKSGEKAVLPAEPTLKGHTFAFWYLGDDEENATAYDFDTPVTGDITLTAKWNINKYTVTFNSYGGTPVPPAQEVEYGLTAAEPATAPTKTGYTFDGWYLGDEKYDFSDAVEQNITLYANWEKNIYTVTYTDGVDGEEVFADQTDRVPFEDTTPAFKGTKTRAGYVFAGWKPAFSDTVTGNVTYVAQWKDDKNNNGIADDEEEKYTVTYTDGVANEEVFADQVYGDLLSGTATPAFKGNPTRDGYVFDGWKPAFSDTVTGNVTYVAQWTARTDLSYTVHYYLKNTTKQVANDKMVAGQTFNADVTENAIRISGYRVYGDSVKSITIGTGTNEIIFYYTRAYHPSTPSKPTLNTGDHYAYVMGYPDGTVRPNGSITRAEVSAILFRLLSDETRDEYFTTESSFTDVKAGAWYNNSIATLEKAGVIVDTAKGGAFRPNEAITRAELAAMLAQFSDAKPVKGVKFSDVSAEHWAYEAIAIAAKMGWIEGYPDGTFRPDATITRAEMMTLVNRALERVPSDEDHLLSKRVMLTFPDCKSGDWFYIAVQEATNSHTYERAATEKNGDEQWIALRANRDWTQLEK